MRLATFTLVEGQDDEEAWNRFVAELNARGLHPADEPLRYDETSMTFRVFSLENEEFPVSLNLDMGRLVGA